ncbi:MAG: exosortase/archaeosortase family protein [Acidobacteria bacterium]|nr:exosortase/archaeosortase family protein [Acidobacteriota bacterium]MBI3471890.1 exosortase/archaeosortase family protein [Candidatus Solibacter usitatus]
MSDSQSSSPRVPWMAIVWFGALLIACYAPVLARLVKQWENDEDMGHGFFVPVIAAYIAWQKREEILNAVGAPNGWGLMLVIYSAVQLTVATLGAEIFLARTAFVLAAIGAFLYLGGTGAVRALAFPLFLLFFMIPIPNIFYNMITFPLQILASQMAEFVLMFLGFPVLREGNVLELAGQRLQVVEACSGIRSLLSLSFLSLVYGYFFENRMGMRVTLFFLTVPVALVANASRVTTTGVLSEIRPELARGFFHSASGWVIFMVALLLLVAIHQALTLFHRYIYGKRQLPSE